MDAETREELARVDDFEVDEEGTTEDGTIFSGNGWRRRRRNITPSVGRGIFIRQRGRETRANT